MTNKFQDVTSVTYNTGRGFTTVSGRMIYNEYPRIRGGSVRSFVRLVKMDSQVTVFDCEKSQVEISNIVPAGN